MLELYEEEKISMMGSEVAEKLRDYVKESHVSEIAQVNAIPAPLVMMDQSSSSYMSFTFDDGKDGILVGVCRWFDCGSY